LKNPYRAQSKVNPQREKGRREIANDVFQSLMRASLTGGEYQVVFTVIDRTWGFQKQSALISIEDFRVSTGLSRQGLLKAIKHAEVKRILVVYRNGTKGSEYLFNKHWDTWQLPAHAQLGNQGSLAGEDPLGNHSVPSLATTVDQTSQPQLPSTSQLPVSDTEPVKKGGGRGGAPPKETSKETLKERGPVSIKFDIFWKAYPKKKSKGLAEKVFAKVNPDEQLLATMLATIERAKKSEDWLKNSGQYIPHPATWLNAKGWEDEYLDEGGRRGESRARTSGPNPPQRRHEAPTPEEYRASKERYDARKQHL